MGTRNERQSDMDRRTFVGAAGVAIGSAMLAAAPRSARAQQPGDRSSGKAKNLIMLIADGMSVGALTIADQAQRRINGEQSRWLAWMNEPDVHAALIETTPAVGLLTDSAAGASAWGIGRRVANGAISTTTDGRTPTPLFLRAKQAGKRIGLVTTSYLSDATPSAMLCNAANRSQRKLIATQMIERGLDLGIGGGAADFDKEMLNDRQAVVARSASELRTAISNKPKAPIFGLLSDDVLPFSLDRTEQDATLRELTELAFDAMVDSPQGFCLLVECENTDEAGHANDAASTMRDLLDFEDALDLTIDFVRGRDDTLLVATTDHACGDPGFITYGAGGNAKFDRLMQVNHSLEWVVKGFREIPEDQRDSSTLTALIAQATGVTLTDAEVGFLSRTLAGERVDPFSRANRFTSVIGSLLANHLGVAYSTPDHSSAPVIATAMGPGSERLPAMCHHTGVHDVMMTALGLPEA